MAQRAFLLGGTGKTGVVLARQLAALGWDVVVGSRGAVPASEEFAHVRVDRSDADALRAALEPGADVLVDFAAYEPEHADQLLSFAPILGSAVVVSSGAVYTDAQGRSLEQIREGEIVEFPVPIPERHTTVAPGREGYAAKKAAIERRLMESSALRTTIVRAGAIYGPGDTASREWHFVKRVLDGRQVIVLAYRGESRFHPVSVLNLAELLRLAAERPGDRIVNGGDPDPPSVLEISRIVAAAMDHEWVEVLMPAGPRDEVVGGSPWGVPRPWVLDMTEAEFEVGYRPVSSYANAVRGTIDWLVEVTRDRDWREVLPTAAEHYEKLFDYAAEDAYLDTLKGG
jgi:nucleoside-diphosphate-sugar epimerase